MFFENLVAGILNKYLGQYIENLDTSQLSFGIWGGNAVLTNLIFKPSALQDFDLPVQAVGGQIGKLELSIPWKKLTTESVIITVSNFYLLVQPNQQVQYNEEKENRKQLEFKMKELQRIDDDKAREKLLSENAPGDETFLNYVAFHILKNLIVNIDNIHLRYEDRVTFPNQLYSVGLTLKNINLMNSTETKYVVFKVVDMSCLCIYWNTDSEEMAPLEKELQLSALRNGIATKKSSPKGYQYLLGPVNAIMNITIIVKPELINPPYSLPRVNNAIKLELMLIRITQMQYNYMIKLIETMGRLQKGEKYRKYRPFLFEYRGHYKKWWIFAYECILNEEVIRIRNNWSWDHMKNHIDLSKDYKRLYKEKVIREKYVSKKVFKELEKHEIYFDLDNLIIFRTLVEYQVKVEMEEAKLAKEQAMKTTYSGRLFSFVGSSFRKDSDRTQAFKVGKNVATISKREREQLYEDVGFNSNIIQGVPVEYVDVAIQMELHRFELTITDSLNREIICLEITSVACTINQRKAENGLMILFNINDLVLFGLDQNGYRPMILMTRKMLTDMKLFEFMYEKNPVDKLCDNRIIIVIGNPLQILYDKKTVEQLSAVFNLLYDDNLSATTSRKVVIDDTQTYEINERTATGMEYVLSGHSYTELSIDIIAPFFIIPFNGFNIGAPSTLIIDTGRVLISSKPRINKSVADMYAKKFDQEKILEVIMEQSYDEYCIAISQIQIMLAMDQEQWIDIIIEPRITPLHIVEPIFIDIIVQKCRIVDDTRLPILKVNVNMKKLTINICDTRMIELYRLLQTLLPESKEEIIVQELKNKKEVLATKVVIQPVIKRSAKQEDNNFIPSAQRIKMEKYSKLIPLEFSFVMKELVVALYHESARDGDALMYSQRAKSRPHFRNKVLSFHVLSLDINVVKMIFETNIDLKLGGISLQHYRGMNIQIIRTPMSMESEKYLITAALSQLNQKYPLFVRHKLPQICLTLNISELSILLHMQALLELVKVYSDIKQYYHSIFHRTRMSTEFLGAAIEIKPSSKNLPTATPTVFNSVLVPREPVVTDIYFIIIVDLDKICVEMEDENRKLAYLLLSGMSTTIRQTNVSQRVVSILKNINIMDYNPKSIYKEILSLADSDALRCEIIMNYLATDNKKSDKLTIVAGIGCVKIVFLNWFVNTIVEFVNNFETAANAIKEKAVETAKELVDNITTVNTADRISLDIKINAPIITIPLDSRSQIVFVVDFGFITIENEFVAYNIESIDYGNAIIEESYIHILQMKVTRTIYNEDFEKHEEVVILHPSSCHFEIKRNLSALWYNWIPNISIKCKVGGFRVHISEADFNAMMDVKDRNMKEGYGDIKRDSISVRSLKREYGTDAPDWNRRSTGAGMQITTTMQAASSFLKTRENRTFLKEINTKIKFTFDLDHFCIDLYNSPNKELIHVNKNRTARLKLEKLKVKFVQQSDESITAELLLADVTLDDLRVYRQRHISRYLGRVIEAEQRYLLNAELRTKADAMFVSIQMYKMFLIINLEFFMVMAKFFTKEPGYYPFEEVESNEFSESDSNIGSIRRLQADLNVTQVNSRKQSMLLIDFICQQPDIAFVDSTEDINCHSLIINLYIIANVRIAGPQTTLTGKICDIHVYTCVYNPLHRAESMYSVLNSFCIDFIGGVPREEGVHVDIMFSNVKLSFTPASINIIKKVMERLTLKTEQEVEKIEEDHTDAWNQQTFKDTDFWFLPHKYSTHSLKNIVSDFVMNDVEASSEMCLAHFPSIVFEIDIGMGHVVQPTILLEIHIHICVRNWSTALSCTSNIYIQMSYFNNIYGVWEPVIEPIETYKQNKIVYKPFKMIIEFESNVESKFSDGNITGKLVTIRTTQNLQLLITGKFLELINEVSRSLSVEILDDPLKYLENISTPYIIRNNTGMEITLLFDNTVMIFPGHAKLKQMEMAPGAEIGLGVRKKASEIHIIKNMATDVSVLTEEKYIKISVNLCKTILYIPVHKCDVRYFSLRYKSISRDIWGLISEVHQQRGGTIVTLRSTVQIYNSLLVPIDVYYKSTPGKRALQYLGTVQSESSYELLIPDVYSESCEMYFKPPDFEMNVQPFIWRYIKEQEKHCPLIEFPSANRKLKFLIKMSVERNSVKYEHTARQTSQSLYYIIRLTTPIVLHNYLPVNLSIILPTTVYTLSPGEPMQLCILEPNTTYYCLVITHLEREWCAYLDIPEKEDSIICDFNAHGSCILLHLNLGLQITKKQETWYLKLYCPYWLYNQTNMTLSYLKSPKREGLKELHLRNKESKLFTQEDYPSIVFHHADFKGPLLFSYKIKHFFTARNICLRVNNSEWSQKFSIDQVGDVGVVECRGLDRNYKVGVTVTLTFNNLSKQVIFKPYYVIINESKILFECQEDKCRSDPWIKVESNNCAPFWPRSSYQSIVVRAVGKPQVTKPMTYSRTHQALLKLENIHGGVYLTIQVNIDSILITLSSYRTHLAPVLIINHTQSVVKLYEKGYSESANLITWFSSLLYTWENPDTVNRLVFEYRTSGPIEINMTEDCRGYLIMQKVFKLTNEPTAAEQRNLRSLNFDNVVYWSLFVDGTNGQRTLLITTEESAVDKTHSIDCPSRIDSEIVIAIYGICLTMVDSETRKSVLFVSIYGTGFMWEISKFNKESYKPLSYHDSSALEVAYANYLEIFDTENLHSRIVVNGKLEVDFQHNLMYRPHTRKMRRSFISGFWAKRRQSEHRNTLHIKINRIQVDNQNHHCTFPVVFAACPMPAGVASNEIIPFIEVSFVERIYPDAPITVYEYLKVLIQEFHLNIDLGFVLSTVNMLKSNDNSDQENYALLEKDIEKSNKTLYSLVLTESQEHMKDLFLLFHFSPLKFHLSLSMDGSEQYIVPSSLLTFFQGIGRSLTDVHDVIFRLSYYEVKHKFISKNQQIKNLKEHYINQALKQLYVLVFGLDVLGNPFGLASGLVSGIGGLFYEPIMGAVKGPQQFQKGLSRGVRNLITQTVGGVAGTISRISGTIGKTIALISCDNAYKERRRLQLTRRAPTFQSSIARNVEGLGLNVVDGVTGIFLKPAEGVNENGAKGFVKGVGVGTLGIVIKPVGGFFDCIAGSFDAVARASGRENEILRMRVPRFIAEGAIQPYNSRTANGNQILRDLAPTALYKNDIYETHEYVVPNKTLILLTNMRILYLKKNEILKLWKIEWQYKWSEIKKPIEIRDTGIVLQYTLTSPRRYKERVIHIPNERKQAIGELMEKLRLNLI